MEPELVVATGQGGSRPDITVERVAINLDDAQGPDNKGNQPVDAPIVPEVRGEAEKLLKSARELGPSDFLTGDPEWPAPGSDLQANIINMFRYASGHPVITSLDDLEQWLPEYGWEVGGFPELSKGEHGDPEAAPQCVFEQRRPS